MTIQPYHEEQPYQRREDAMSAAIATYVAAGWRVEFVTGSTAVLVTGHKPNHLLHAILTLFTCFMWSIVWLAVAVTTHESRMTLTVLADGRVHHSSAQRSG